MKKLIQYILPVTALILAGAVSSCNRDEKTSPVRKNLEEAVFASGFVEQEDNYTVSAKVEGIILSLPVKEGDSLEKDALVAVIENDVQNNNLKDAEAVYADALRDASPGSPRLVGLQSQIQQAEQQLGFDEDNYRRYKELYEKNSVSQLDFEKAELQFQASKNNLVQLQKNLADLESSLQLSVERSRVQVNNQKAMLGDYRLVTEAKGVVVNVFRKQGELARRGEPIAQIGSGDYLIKLFVSEEDITKVKKGDTALVSINTYPNRTFRARISKIYPGFDEVEQSYVVEAQFLEFPEKLFTGTQLQANIDTGNRDSVLVIPTSYVLRGSFVLLEKGEQKRIVTGSRNSDWTEVISGLTEEDVIVKPD